MNPSSAAFIIKLALGLEVGSSDLAEGNRCSLQGVTWKADEDGEIEVRIDRFEAADVRVASGSLVLEIGRITARAFLARVHTASGTLRLAAAGAEEVAFSDLKLHGPLVMPSQLQEALKAARPNDAGAPSKDVVAAAWPADAWRLAPLAEAEGTIQSRITDAHLLFDADVTVPIRHGEIDFNQATVEHVGPDSRMGVSRLGLYVDAPNGRSYLYQFASAPLAGVEFERRGALLGPWISERGKLQLQAFAESMLRQGRRGPGQGLTEQARTLLDRTAISGTVHLGDGVFALPGMHVRFDGRDGGSNQVRLRSRSAGGGITAEVDSASLRDASLMWRGAQACFEQMTAALQLEIVVDGSQASFSLNVDHGTITGLRMGPPAGPAAQTHG